jgi:hypothetical protein
MRIFGPMIASEFAEKMDSAGVFIIAVIVVMVVSAAWNEFAPSDVHESSAHQRHSDVSGEPAEPAEPAENVAPGKNSASADGSDSGEHSASADGSDSGEHSASADSSDSGEHSVSANGSDYGEHSVSAERSHGDSLPKSQDFAAHNSFDSRSNTFKLPHDASGRSH